MRVHWIVMKHKLIIDDKTNCKCKNSIITNILSAYITWFWLSTNYKVKYWWKPEVWCLGKKVLSGVSVN